mmetsp:Transcript_4268/g.12061  ORF Transcript_4268/g.12061 Transcript_4268/m.12061 type:complete len:182 (+) Transcript_4268:64-609(+)
MCIKSDVQAFENTHRLNIALLVFGILSLLGFFVNPYGGIAGLLTVIAASLIICCAGNGGPVPQDIGCKLMASVVLHSIATIAYGIIMILVLVFYLNLVAQIQQFCDADGVADADCEQQRAITLGFLNIFIWPVIIFQLICVILGVPTIIYGLRARTEFQARMQHAPPTATAVTVVQATVAA